MKLFTSHDIRFRGMALLAVSLLLGQPVMAEDSPPVDDLTRGAKLWVDNCGRCHNMRDPKEFNDDQWRVITMHMRVRAGFTGQDTRDMRAFLQSAN